uniref:PAK4-inhibitor INKA2 n=1 Tax=Electrophorus electricus TaxID=8005 RepID=A0A4W4FTR3_ELEEL
VEQLVVVIACYLSIKPNLSMTEAGDGLHDQMLSMMGALQELKLLQVQTALEQLELSGKSRVARRQEKQGHPQNPHSCITGTSPSASSMGSESTHAKGQNSIQPSELSPADLSGILHSLSREGPSLDNNYTEDSFDRSRDWTSTLMSCSRNRQPLVLGDNVLADLVGNWLDLPDLEKEAEFGLCGSDCPTCPLQLGRPQELSKRFSLTGNLFKKLLRSVRPDREKLLKQKPGWMPPRSDREAELVKRPKKAAKAKGSFYLPFWSGSQQLGEPMEKVQPLFDYSTAVWV